jgi:hypothetical protein
MQEPQVRTLTAQQQTIENDIENIVRYWRWNSKGAWKTGIQKVQIGRLTHWLKSRVMRTIDETYVLRDERVFDWEPYELNKKERAAQTKLYDALTNGFHGNRIENEMQSGYRFKLEDHNFQGWVPHAYIFAWMREKSGLGRDMTAKVFWNIILNTIGDIDQEHSYRVIYWPALWMAFVKVEKTVSQLGRAANKRKMHNVDQDGAWRWNKGNTWDGGQQASGSASTDTSGWQDWSGEATWRQHNFEENEPPEYDAEGKMIVQA